MMSKKKIVLIALGIGLLSVLLFKDDLTKKDTSQQIKQQVLHLKVKE